MSTVASADPARCPLCAAPNGCALAAGAAVTECWCLNVLVAPAALARLPEHERDRRCLCPACAAAPAQPATR